MEVVVADNIEFTVGGQPLVFRDNCVDFWNADVINALDRALLAVATDNADLREKALIDLYRPVIFEYSEGLDGFLYAIIDGMMKYEIKHGHEPSKIYLSKYLAVSVITDIFGNLEGYSFSLRPKPFELFVCHVVINDLLGDKVVIL